MFILRKFWHVYVSEVKNMILLYATTNSAKLDSMRRVLDSLSIELTGLCDLNLPLPDVAETGKNPLENAVLKAKIYYEALHTPLFSCDSGLYFEELPDELQSGTHIRRVGGRSLTDEEMISYYSDLAGKHGGTLTGRYKNAVCLIFDPDHIYSSMDESIWTEPFLLTDTPHSKRVAGYPLDSLSLDCKTRKYYYDLPDQEEDSSTVDAGYRAFFEAHCRDGMR